MRTLGFRKSSGPGSDSPAGRSVEVRVEAHKLEVVLFGGHVLVGIIEIQPEVPSNLRYASKVTRCQSDYLHRAINKDVLDELLEGASFVSAEQRDGNGE
jgi:hypothetical protein